METIAAKAATDLAAQGTGWLVAVLVGCFALFLYLEGRRKNDQIVTLATSLAKVAAEAIAAGREQTASVERSNAVAEARTRAIDELSRSNDLVAADVRHGFNNFETGQKAVIEVLRENRAGIAELSRELQRRP